MSDEKRDHPERVLETAPHGLVAVDPDEAVPDPVDEMERESFPASDPPSSWAGSD